MVQGSIAADAAGSRVAGLWTCVIEEEVAIRTIRGKTAEQGSFTIPSPIQAAA